MLPPIMTPPLLFIYLFIYKSRLTDSNPLLGPFTQGYNLHCNPSQATNHRHKTLIGSVFGLIDYQFVTIEVVLTTKAPSDF